MAFYPLNSNLHDLKYVEVLSWSTTSGGGTIINANGGNVNSGSGTVSGTILQTTYNINNGYRGVTALAKCHGYIYNLSSNTVSNFSVKSGGTILSPVIYTTNIKIFAWAG